GPAWVHMRDAEWLQRNKRRQTVSQNDSPATASFTLNNCANNNHYPNSNQSRERRTYGQRAPKAGHASRRKSNSYPQESAQQQAAQPRGPDRSRGRAGDECGEEEPLGASGRHNGAAGLPAWTAGVRACGPAVGSDRVFLSDASRTPGEAGGAKHPSGS